MAVVIRNCNLVDVKGGTIVPNTVLAIEGEQIAGISHDGQQNSLQVSSVVEANGSFVLPGLIDMHVHACLNPHSASGAVRRRDDSATVMGILAVNNLRLSLQTGITTVRDVGAGLDAAFEVKMAWQAGLIQGSRPYVAGPMITAIGGHGTEDHLRIGIGVCGLEEVRRTVRTAIAKGADLIKVSTWGAATHTELTLEELKAAVEEAHWSGRKVASHANFRSQSIKNSVLAGCDTVEHGCVLDDEIIAKMADQGTSLCPTIVVLARILQSPDAYGGPDSRLVENVRNIWDIHREGFYKAYQRNVSIIAGSDAGVTGVSFDALVEELQLMVQWGMTPLDAIRSATVNAARVLGHSELGSVEVQKVADLLFVESNPLTDIRALTAVRAVMQNGKFVRSEFNING